VTGQRQKATKGKGTQMWKSYTSQSLT